MSETSEHAPDCNVRLGFSKGEICNCQPKKETPRPTGRRYSSVDKIVAELSPGVQAEYARLEIEENLSAIRKAPLVEILKKVRRGLDGAPTSFGLRREVELIDAALMLLGEGEK